MKDTERKLATILATDCVSFSKYMEDSEEKTLRNLNECRKIIDNKILYFVESSSDKKVIPNFLLHDTVFWLWHHAPIEFEY